MALPTVEEDKELHVEGVKCAFCGFGRCEELVHPICNCISPLQAHAFCMEQFAKCLKCKSTIRGAKYYFSTRLVTAHISSYSIFYKICECKTVEPSLFPNPVECKTCNSSIIGAKYFFSERRMSRSWKLFTLILLRRLNTKKYVNYLITKGVVSFLFSK